MAEYEVVYFDGKGGAEVTRLVLTLAGKEFKDTRLSGDEWKAVKPTLPFGLLPVLKTKGLVLNDSAAINAYLGRTLNLEGSTPEETAQAQGVVLAVGDVVPKHSAILLGPEDRREDGFTAFYRDLYPEIARRVEAFVRGPFLLGEKATVYDCYLYYVFGEVFARGDVSVYPKLSGLVQNFKSIPSIANYLAKRKPTPW